MISSLRVLDEKAFAELAGKLDALIARAAKSSRELDELFKRTQGLNEHAEQAKAELDKRLVLSARILQVTKDQLDNVEQAVKALTDRQSRIDMLSAKVDAQLGEFHAHMGKAVEDVDRTVERAVDGLDAQQEAGLQARERADRLLATASDLTDRFADLQARMAAGTDRYEQGLARVLAEMDRSASQAARTSSKLDEQVFALKARITAFTDGIEGWLKPAFDEITVIRHDADDGRRELRGHINDLGDRLDDAVRRLDARVEASLAELGRRQEAAAPTADAIKAELAELATKISGSFEGRLDEFHDRLREERAQVEAAVNRLEQHLSPVLSELASRAESADAARSEMREHAAALKRQLTEAVSNLQAQFDGAVGRLEEQHAKTRAEIGDRVTRDQEQATRLDQELHELHARLSSVLVQVDERLSTALRELGDAASKDDESVVRLEGRLADVQAELATISTQVEQRVAEILGRLEGQTADAGAEAAAQLSELATGHERLSSAIARLEERLSSGLEDLRDAPKQDDPRASRVEGQLAEMQAQLTGISTQVEQRLADTLNRLEGQSADADAETASRLTDLAGGHEQLRNAIGRVEERLASAVDDLNDASSKDDPQASRLEGQLTEMQAQLTGISTQVEQRLADTLNRLEGQSADADAETASRLTDLAGGQERLSAALSRLDEYVSGALTDLGNAPSGDAEHVLRLEEQLADMKAQLAALFEQVDDRVADAATAIEGRGADATADVAARLEALSGSHDQHARSIGRAIGRLEQQIATTLEGITGDDPKADDRAAELEEQLGELKAQVVAVRDQLDHDVAPALAALQTTDDGETTTRLSEIAANNEQLATSIGRLEDRLLDAVRELGEATSKDDAEAGGLEARLDELKAELSAVLDRVDERVGRAVEDAAQRGTATTADIAARLDELAGSQDQQGRSLGRAVAQLEQQITSALAELTAAGTRDDGRESAIEEELNQLRAQLGSGFSQVDARVADALAAGQEKGTDIGADVAARLDDLAARHEQLGSAVARLQEQITSALADLAAAPAPSSDAGSEKVEQQLGQLRAQVSTIFNQLDERLSEALAGAEDREGATGGEASAPAGGDVQAGMDELQQQLGSAVARLESQVSSVRSDLTHKTTKTYEQTERLEHHLADLKELLSGVAVRMDDERDRPAAPGGSGLDVGQGMAALREHLDGQMASLARSHEEFEAIVERFEQKLTMARPPVSGDSSAGMSDERTERLEQHLADVKELLSGVAVRIDGGLETAGDGSAGGAEIAALREHVDEQLSQLADSHAQLGSVLENLQAQVTAALGGSGEDGAPADANVQSGLAELQQQLGSAVARLETQVSSVRTEVARELSKSHGDSAVAQLSELTTSHEQLNSAVGRLEDRLSAALMDIASSETSIETESGSTVERELALVAERLASLGAKMENDVEPVLAALQQREPEDGIEKTLEDLRSQLSELTQHVDQRVSAALSQMGTQAAPPDGKAAAEAPAPAPAKKPVGRKKLPPDELVGALIESLNTGDQRVIREFVASQYSDSALQERRVKDRVEVYMSFHDESGEVIVTDIDKSNKEQIVAIVQETDSPQRHRFVIMLDPTPPHKIYVVNIDAL
jgi:chromosome segregation ATPase